MRAASLLALLALAACAEPERPVLLEPAPAADAWWPEIVQCTQQPWLSWCRAECTAAAGRGAPLPGWCS